MGRRGRRGGAQAGGAGEGEGEAGSLLSREPNAGLYPRTPGSRPEPEADAATEPPTQVPLIF